MPDPLPGFTWDKRVARYRATITARGIRAGRFVSRRSVLGLLEKSIAESERRLVGLTAQFQAGRLTASEWQISFARQLKTNYLQNAALGAGGWDRLTQSDYGRIGGMLRGEYARLPKFAQGIIDETISARQASARSVQYGGKARAMYWSTSVQTEIAIGKTERKRILGDARHCTTCPEFASRGWIPITDGMPWPGSHQECFGWCYCTEIFR